MVWLQKMINQTGKVRLKVALIMMLVVLVGMAASINTQSLSAQAQVGDCTPSLHRLLLNGQQVAISPGQLDAFTDDTPVSVNSVQRRFDKLVIEEGFASIPLKPNQAKGNRPPKLKASGTVYERWYGWNIPRYVVWRVRNQSAQAKTVTVKSLYYVFDWRRWRWKARHGGFSKTVLIPAYSDGFVRSDETWRWAYHQLVENKRHRGLKRASRRVYRDARLVELGTTIPLYQAVQEQGVVSLDNAGLEGGVSLSAAGRLETEVAGEYRSVWKISNGSDASQNVTLEALDSDFTKSITLPAKSDTYVLSDEDGCIDNPLSDKEALWVAESEGLLKILTGSGEIAFELAIDEPIDALSVSPIDRTVWVLTEGKRLEGFDSQGLSVSDAQLDLATPVTDLVVGSQSAWLISGSHVFVSARDGTSPIQSVDFQEPVQALVYDSLRDRVWVVLSGKLVAIDRLGAQSNEIEISPDTVPVAAYDKRLDTIWLVRTKNATEWIERYNLSGDQLASYDTNTTSNWSKASADANGGLWLANASNIAHVTRDAELQYSLPAFSDVADTQIVDIAGGAAAGSLWVANQTVLKQVDTTGSVLKTLIPDLGDGVIRNLNHIDLETELPDTIPTVTITSPTDGDWFNETPSLRLNITPNGADSATIAMLDNGLKISSVCRSDNGETVCTLPNLNDGLHSISLTVNAADGAVSEPATVSFSIDTIAPQITITAPVDGASVFNAVVTVAGSVSEFAEVSINDQIMALNNNQFSANVTLLEGLNSIVVAAIDRAGNATTQSVSVTYNANQPPVIDSDPVLTVKAENNYFYDVNATDPDGDALSYSLSQSPAGMAIDETTGEINWTPASQGSAEVTVNVNDGRGGSVQQSFTITVSPANQPPVITSTPIQQIAVDANYIYNVTATDPDNDTLSYRFLDAPNGMRIDARSGQITWQPYVVDTSTVLIEVSDPAGLIAQQAYRVTVVYTDGKEPPVMQAIGDLIVSLGQTTRLTVQASDLQGQPLTYSIAPLPLPDGMSLHEVTGEFEYRPVVSDVGSRFYTIKVSDGRFSSSQTVKITVPPQGTNTRLRGKTLLPDGTGLQGVRFEMGGQEAVSDANGDFLIEHIPGPSERKRFIVDGSGVDPSLGTFATIPEQFDIVAGVENHLHAPVYLMPLDIASADDVDPFQETVISSSDVIIDGVNYGPIEITIDPKTAHVDATGELYDDIISISRIPDAEFGPAPMPEDIGLSLYIAVQPFGVKYSTPARVSFPNVESFPVGTIVDILGLNHDTGAFEKTGEAQVSADGKHVVSIGGAVFNNSWHGFSPRPPDPTPPPDDCDCDKGGSAASTYGVKTGNFSDDHSTVPYYSLGQPRNLNFVYNSKWANPSPILNFDTLAGLPPPVAMSQKLLVGGIETNEVFIKPGDLGSALTGSALNAIQFNAREFVSGVYPYEYVIDCHFPISRRAGRAQGDVVIINESKSPFGAGWSISNLRKLHIAADRSKVAMDLGSGNFWLFKKNALGEFEAPPGHYSTLVENPDATFTVTTKSGTAYQFNALGLQASMADRNGNTTSYIYDGRDRLTKVTDPLGLETNLRYIGSVLSTVTDAAGRVTQFEHDAQGNLTKITDPDDSYRTFGYTPDKNLMVAKTNKRRFESTIVYDQHDRFQSATLPDGTVRQAKPQDIAALPDLRNNTGTMQDLAPTPPSPDKIDSGYTDGNGNAMSYKMTASGYLAEMTDAVGRTSQYQRDDDNNVIQTTRPNGSVVRRTYDDNGNVLTETEEFNGATTTYTYDQFSLVTSMKDALGRITVMQRDNKGNLIRQENAVGHETLFEYNNRGQVTKITDPNGLVTTLAYNSQGLVETKTETPPSGAARGTTMQYDSTGMMTQITTPDGIMQTINYDALNRPLRVQNQLSEAQLTSYDDYGNVIEVKVLNADESVATTETRVYDNRNRVIEISRPHNDGIFSVIRQEYDNNSNLKKITDPDGKATQYFYDGENRTIQTIQPDGGRVFYDYDLRDQVTRVQAANDATTTYEYDVLARKLAENSPDRGRWEWAYDLVNNVTAQTDDRGVVIGYQYDSLNRRTDKAYPTAAENVSYTYDDCTAGVGRMCERFDESGGYSYHYDVFGNVLSHQKQELGITYTTSYDYDAGDNVISSSYPTGRRVHYQRDAVRRLAGISSNGQTITNNFQYRGDSRLIGRSWNNELSETRSYDQQGRITQISLGSIGNRRYQYDASSNITQIESPFQSGQYDYDQNDRLQQEVLNDTQSTDYQYDFNGNRLTKQINDAINGNQSENYLYQSQSNKLLNSESIAPDGTTTETDQRTYQYNDANRVRSITIDNEVVGTYYYNDLGLRTRKITPDDLGNPAITLYHYNLEGALIAETTETGQTQKDYLWNGMEPVAQTQASGITYLHSDHLYTARLATDELQTTAWQWESGAFGNAEPQIETREVNLRFPGQYRDQESGLFYNWNRYYDAGLGRYVTSDPIGLLRNYDNVLFLHENISSPTKVGVWPESNTNHLFGYVEQNPLKYTDFYGLEADCDKCDPDKPPKGQCVISCPGAAKCVDCCRAKARKHKGSNFGRGRNFIKCKNFCLGRTGT